MIVDGKQIAKEILQEVKASIDGKKVVVRVVAVAPNNVTKQYLSIKSARAKDAGVELEVKVFPDTVAQQEVVDSVKGEGVDAVVVQLPLPEHLSTENILNAIPADKDVDVLSQEAYARFTEGGMEPPVVGAVREILQRGGVEVKHAKVLVIGAGRLVGKPVFDWFQKQGAVVSVFTKESHKLLDFEQADIIVSGAGQPHFITGDMLHPGTVVIDAGASESNGAIVGDFHPDCAHTARLFTPVPGGVGPITVACLFRNVVETIQKPDA